MGAPLAGRGGVEGEEDLDGSWRCEDALRIQRQSARSEGAKRRRCVYPNCTQLRQTLTKTGNPVSLNEQLEDTELTRDPRILQLKLKVLQALRANERPALPPAAASRIEKIRSKIKAHVLPLGKRHAIADSTCPALST
jgi:hypothetical protein